MLRPVRVGASFEPTMIAFGEAPVGVSVDRRVSIVNTGEVTLDELTVDMDVDAFGVESLSGVMIAAGARYEVVVSFAPDEPSTFAGTLHLRSGDESLAALEVAGAGSLEPVFELSASALDFGAVPLGETSTRTVTILNAGRSPGVVTGAAVEAPFALETLLPSEVPPGETLALNVTFEPAAPERYDVPIRFETNAEWTPTLDLQVIGAVEVGALVCDEVMVDFGDVTRGEVAAVDIGCTSTGDVDLADVSVVAEGEVFELVDPPQLGAIDAGATVIVRVEARGVGPQDAHDGALHLAYTTPVGSAVVDIPLAVNVVAPATAGTAIALFLFWDTDLTDFDLHLVRPDGVVFAADDSDCYFENPTEDWGRKGDPIDDPFLDRDDLDGFGPENINMTEAAAGTYQVYVHYFADNRAGSSTARVEVHTGGVLDGVHEQSMSCDELWKVGDLDWDGTNGTFRPTTDVVPAGRGLCF